MFHLFTIQGKQADLPLENLKHDLRVATVGKKYRARKFIEGREDRVAEKHTGTGDAGSPALKAYRESAVRHMPVLSASGDIIGILSERDLLKQLIIRDGKVEAMANRAAEERRSAGLIFIRLC